MIPYNKSFILKYFIPFIIGCSWFGNSVAQNYNPPNMYDQPINFGVGLGIDYGGFGCRLSVLPTKQLVVFLGLGYNVNDFGVNGGASYRFMPSKRACLYYTLMYGYNGVIVVQNAEQYNKTYYGPSTGIGIEIHSGKRPGNYWNFEILVPVRSQKFHDDLRDLKRIPYIKFNSEPLPIAFSIGFHFS